jgi:transposase InsO family protein
MGRRRRRHGLRQPLAAHQHWHVDGSYINIRGAFYYLCSILDGCSRYIVNWDLRESMTEADIEVILERAKELHLLYMEDQLLDREWKKGSAELWFAKNASGAKTHVSISIASRSREPEPRM